MAREIINIGLQPNDGKGDTLRQLGIKVNNNFTQLFDAVFHDSDSAGMSDSDIQYISKQINFVGISFDNILNFEEGSEEVTNTLPSTTGVILNNNSVSFIKNKTFNNLMLSDSENGNKYILTPSIIDSDTIINLPPVLDSDTFLFAETYQDVFNKTYYAPRIADYLADSNGAPIISINRVLSAANNVSISNAQKGNSPTISVIGNPDYQPLDSDIDLTIETKGLGVLKINNPLVKENDIVDFTSGVSSDSDLSLDKEITHFTGDSDGQIILPTPIKENFVKKLINISNNNVEVIPEVFTNGSSIVMKPNSVVKLHYTSLVGWMLEENIIYDSTETNALWYVKQ
jgi:hypothetical protein